MIKILLADNQPLTASGLIHFFEGRDEIALAGTVKTRHDFPALLREHDPALLIVDYNLPGYINKDDLLQVQTIAPETNILILSSDSDAKSILDILRTGVKGYVTKECNLEEILTAIKAVARGEKFFCQKVLDIIIESSLSPEPPPHKPGSSLTERELELLKLLAKGYSTQRAADALNLSPHTIHSHRKNIIKKLGIKSPTQFVLYAIDLGLM